MADYVYIHFHTFFPPGSSSCNVIVTAVIVLLSVEISNKMHSFMPALLVIMFRSYSMFIGVDDVIFYIQSRVHILEKVRIKKSAEW